ncbi:MAG: hypothetical protein GF332_02205 [Candidatus Moranbacteria bacterium]|nr:hypothetical protein [Candidatus Moranbacteria bacterium]
MQINTKAQIIQECKKAQDENLEVALTIRNDQGKEDEPAVFPEDIEKYQETLRQIIRKCRPAIAAIEYKETSDLYYKSKAELYKKQLDLASKIVREEGAKVTNGGMECDLLVLLIYYDLLEQGKNSQAEAFKNRAFDQVKKHMFKSEAYQKTIKRLLKKAQNYMRVYKYANIDYVNLHWSIDDAQVFEQAVEFIRNKTDRDVVTTEIRQPTDPKKAKLLMKKAAQLKLPCVVWFFGIEGPDISFIQKKDGDLSDLSKKFKRFIRFRFMDRPRLRNEKV